MNNHVFNQTQLFFEGTVERSEGLG